MSRKIIKISLIVLAVFFLIVYLVVLFGLAPIVNKVTSKFAPEILGCEVTIDDVDVYPAFNGCTVQGIIVGNPEGFNTETAFILDEVTVQVQLTSLTSDTIVVKNVIVDGARVTYEQDLNTANLFTIQKNIEEYVKKLSEGKVVDETPEEDTVAEELTEGSKKLVIENFEFKNAKVDFSAVIMGGKSMTLPVPNIQLKDIGKDEDGGASISDIIREIFNEIVKSCTNVVSGVGRGLKKAGGAVIGGAKDLGSGTVNVIKDAGSIFGLGGSKEEKKDDEK